MTHVLTPATRIGLSIAFATGLYGISFGALSIASGLGFWQTMALSLLMFTGGSQFAYIGVLAGGGNGGSAFAAASLLGVRNAVYGVQVNRLLRPHGWRRWLAAHVTIDESTATAVGQDDPAEQRRGFWVAGLGVFVLWNLSTALGALLGDVVGDPRRWREPVAIAVVCALATVLALPWLPAGVPILLAAAVAAAWALVPARAGRHR